MSETLKVTNGDIVFTKESGTLSLVSDRQKLSQDLLNILSVEINPDIGWGAGLQSLIGQVPHNQNFAKLLITQRIADAVGSLQDFQNLRPGITPDSERIREVRNIFVRRVNATDYLFTLEVLTVARTVETLTCVVREAV